MFGDDYSIDAYNKDKIVLKANDITVDLEQGDFTIDSAGKGFTLRIDVTTLFSSQDATEAILQLVLSFKKGLLFY